jgi:hypothetical protein
MKPFGRRLLARRDPALTDGQIADNLAPLGSVAQYVASPEDLEAELTDRQRETLELMRHVHDEAHVDRVLSSCGTAWVITTDFDGGSRHIVHHTLTRDGVPI